jgi:hypothetical protein
MPMNLKLLNSAWQYHMLQMFRIHGTMTLCYVRFALHDGRKVLKLCCLVLDVLHALIITGLNVLQVFQLPYRSMIDLHWSQTLLCERYIKQTFILFHYSETMNILRQDIGCQRGAWQISEENFIYLILAALPGWSTGPHHSKLSVSTNGARTFCCSSVYGWALNPSLHHNIRNEELGDTKEASATQKMLPKV